MAKSDRPMTYAGIGSRDAPGDVLREFQRLGKVLALRGLTLRSGGADGCDLAFEVGCDQVVGEKEIFLPTEASARPSMWAEKRKINPRRDGRTAYISPEAYDTVNQYHPAPKKLGYFAKRAMARNAHILLGRKLDDPVAFVICYTYQGRVEGGTAQAIRIAMDRRIELFNVGTPGELERLEKYINDRL